MKRIPAILFLTIFLVNGTGFYVYYVIQLRQIKAEMRETLKLLPDHDLEVLTLSTKEYQEYKVDDHEVLVKGKMYDIARIKVQGDIVRIYCLHDAKEDNLIALVTEIICKPLKDKDSIPSQIIQFISLAYILPIEDSRIWADGNEIIQVFHYSFSIKIFSAPLESPPPRA